MRQILLTTLFVTLSPSVIANHYLQLSGDVTKFDYQEHSSTGIKLNKETGFMHGVLTGYGYTYDNIGFNLTAGYYSGNVDYQGKTQTGTPLTTTTDEQFTDIGAELSWYPTPLNFGVYTKFEWLEWQRNIQATNKTIALHETYQWQNFEAGFISPIFQYGRHQLEFKFGLSHSKNGQLEVNLSTIGFGKPMLDLGDGTGFSASLNYHFKLSDSNRLSIGLAHKQWTFSQGEDKSVSSNANTMVIREPKSDSKRTSIFLNYRFNLNDIFRANLAN